MIASASRFNPHASRTDGPLPVLPSEDVISDRAKDHHVTVVFVKIDNFDKLCAATDGVGGAGVFRSLEDTFQELIPDPVEGFRLLRSGFLYLMEGDASKNYIENVAQRLVNATKSPLDVEGRDVNVSVSIGIARSSHDGDGTGLLDRAQFAQYGASEESGSSYQFFDSEKAEKIRNEVILKNDLFTALERDEFFLKYQPVVSLEDYTVRGAEALIRWDHPDRGLISPGEFIPLAEKTGQIIFLDRWVIKKAIKEAARWQREYDRKLPIGVNISAWQFRDDYLVDKISEMLEETGLEPSCLKVEVTETSMMQDVERTGRVLQALDDLGVKIALDDFGTGHATFEYLSQFPIDELKIDRSFLDFDDVYAKNQKLVDIMIETGKRVGTNILAEGIETDEQLTFLRNRGCETAQGFLFSKPLDQPEFESLVADGKTLYEP